jgi:hypothetical protein
MSKQHAGPITFLDNGNLVIKASNSVRAALADAYRSRGYYAAEFRVAEHLHEVMYFIPPENIGALTDSPILSPDVEYPDDARGPVPYGDTPVYWFPNYMVQDPWAELRNTGRVVFTRAG